MAIEASLILATGLMGLAGSPHCAAMCGAPCAAALGGGAAGGGRLAGFALGRALGYAAGGAAVAGSVALLARIGEAAPALRTVWLLAQLGAFGFGLALMLRGRPPAVWERFGRAPAAVPIAIAPAGWPRVAAPLRAGAAGSLWVAWPCGLLQSALLVASLANTPLQGALVMGGFAAASAAGLLLGPALWYRWAGGRSPSWLAGALGGGLAGGLAVRLAGLALVLASAWALGHGLWLRFAAWCFS